MPDPMITPPASLPMQTRAAPLSSVDAEARTVDVTFSTGATVRRVRWGGWDTAVPFDETLEVSERAVNMERLSRGAPVLSQHSTWSLDSQLGVVERAWIEGGEARATLRFPRPGVSEAADRAFAMIEQGISRNVSVGYSIDKVKVTRATDTEVEKRLIVRWTPYEISLVTISADPAAQTRAAVETYPLEIVNRGAAPATKETAMDPEIIADAGSAPATTEARAAAQQPDDAARALSAERARSAEITALATRHQMPADFTRQHIEAGTAIDEVRKLVLDDVASRSATVDTRIHVVTDEGDTRRAAIETAITHRADPASVELTDAGRQYRGMSLLEIGRTFIEEERGIKLRGLGKAELAGALLGLDVRSGMMSTSDFANVLSNIVSKRLRDAYGSTRQTWRPFCRQSNAPDFKERAIVQLTGSPELKKVREGEEYTYAALADSVEKYAIATYGRIIAVTRQTLINDDLGAFSRLPTMYGRAAANLESDIVWGILTGNPTMGDGVALFHADHGNIITAGAPSEAALEAGEIAMGAQLDAAGKPLNLRARYLAVSRKHKVAAMKLLTAVSQTKVGDVNVYANSMDLIVEDRLYNASGNSMWFMIGDPAEFDTIEYAYLDGQEGLFTEQRLGFNVDGIEVKGRLDFGAKAIDHKAFQKNAGN